MSFNIWVRDNLFLKNYVTSERVVLHCFILSIFANNYFEYLCVPAYLSRSPWEYFITRARPTWLDGPLTQWTSAEHTWNNPWEPSGLVDHHRTHHLVGTIQLSGLWDWLVIDHVCSPGPNGAEHWRVKRSKLLPSAFNSVIKLLYYFSVTKTQRKFF